MSTNILKNPDLNPAYLAALTSSAEISPSALVDLLADLESSAYAPLQPNPELIANYYSSYFFALFLVDDLNEARFLSKRIHPQLLQSDVLLVSTYTLLRALYTRSYASIYTTLANAPWSPTITPLATKFLHYFRRKTFILLSEAYKTISPKAAAAYLGLSEAEVVEKTVAEGWNIESETGLLEPVREDEAEEDAGVEDGGKDGRIGRLTGLVTHLTEV